MAVRTSLLGIRAFLVVATCALVACGGGVAADGPDGGDAGALADAPRYPPECRAEDGRCKPECRIGSVFRDIRQNCTGVMDNVFCRPKISLTCSELNCWARAGVDEGLRFLSCLTEAPSVNWQRCSEEEFQWLKDNPSTDCAPNDRDHVEPYD